MITDNDIKKMKEVFVTKKDLKKELKILESKFASKDELKALDLKMGSGFVEIIRYIGETREEIVGIMTKQLEELIDITRRHQMTLENHDSRIVHLEYVNKQ